MAHKCQSNVSRFLFIFPDNFAMAEKATFVLRLGDLCQKYERAHCILIKSYFKLVAEF